MGKSCVYFKSIDDLALDVVAEVTARDSLDRFISYYEEARGSSRKTRRS
jgi:DNA-binding transcriptional regulator YbjK